MLIDGKAIAEKIFSQLKARVAALTFVPLVYDIVVGEDEVQARFVRAKQRAAEKLGIRFLVVQLPAFSALSEVLQEVKKCSSTAGVCGIIVQLPLPPLLSPDVVTAAIPASLDIDRLSGAPAPFVPPTAGAIVRILETLPVDLSSARIVVVGQGMLVGRPVAELLRSRGCVVQTADITTLNTTLLTRAADVVITGVGSPGLIGPGDVREGAVIIDAGTSESAGVMLGDVNPAMSDKAAFMTPVPGGVGPVTVAMLMENAVISAERLDRREE